MAKLTFIHETEYGTYTLSYQNNSFNFEDFQADTFWKQHVLKGLFQERIPTAGEYTNEL